MADPVTTLTANAIVTLAFQKFMELSNSSKVTEAVDNYHRICLNKQNPEWLRHRTTILNQFIFG